jgi:hypothetical protein
MQDPKLPPKFDELSLEELERDPRGCIERLRTSARPAKLAADGEPELVVQSLEAYQHLLERLKRAEATVGIYRGLDEVRRGETVPLDQAFREIRERAAKRRRSA